MSDLVTLSTAEGVATLTLHNPDRLNALSTALFTAFASALRGIERDDSVRAVVLTGSGRGFSAGADLSEFSFPENASGSPVEPPLGTLLRERMNPIILRLRALPKPVIAAVNGVAAGAGMSLALACDIRYAAKSARFIQSFSGIALVPDGGSSYFLPRLVGPARALELMLTAEPLSANQALELGIVSRVVDDEALPAAAHDLAVRLARGPRKAQELIKRMLTGGHEYSLERVLELEAGYQEVASRQADFREGVSAFREKRQPNFGTR